MMHDDDKGIGDRDALVVAVGLCDGDGCSEGEGTVHGPNERWQPMSQ
jgi:hypothetical protein